eukprot:NODE_1363_length_1217_cov_0.886404.p2 type:complete len:110 gc:universal NODE_1363_length_1217_cov_0.886404:405-734(+)
MQIYYKSSLSRILATRFANIRFSEYNSMFPLEIDPFFASGVKLYWTTSFSSNTFNLSFKCFFRNRVLMSSSFSSSVTGNVFSPALLIPSGVFWTIKVVSFQLSNLKILK